jgi:hypothetical protein
MSCRIVVTDGPKPVRLELRGVLDMGDLATMETAARVAIEDGHAIVLDLATRSITPSILDCVARLVAVSTEPLTVRCPRWVIDQLRAGGLDGLVVLDEA